MANYYLTYWIGEHGKENFKELVDKVSANAKLPKKIAEKNLTDEWISNYFLATYFSILLNHFGLNVNQITMCVDILVGPGFNTLFSPEEILKDQKDLIPEFEKYIDEDYNEYYA